MHGRFSISWPIITSSSLSISARSSNWRVLSESCRNSRSSSSITVPCIVKWPLSSLFQEAVYKRRFPMRMRSLPNGQTFGNAASLVFVPPLEDSLSCRRVPTAAVMLRTPSHVRFLAFDVRRGRPPDATSLGIRRNRPSFDYEGMCPFGVSADLFKFRATALRFTAVSASWLDRKRGVFLNPGLKSIP